MRKIYLCLAILFSLCFSTRLFAGPGDTTVVQTSTVLNADNSVSYDTMLVLPTNLTYRKIYLVYTVGSHNCPPGSQYCHQWDYIGNVTIKPPHGDTIELARIITPFATSGWARFPAPPNWKQDYVFDVTDFAPYLQDTVTINSMLGVGSPGFDIHTKLIFIEGTPDRNIIGINGIYGHGGNFGGGLYGSAADPINNHLPVVNETAPAGTVSAAFRVIVTGHGSDTFQCCEFAEHYYNLYLNGTSILQQNVWRDDCGLNPVYPQGGTWLFNRSNWCPGASVRPYYHNLTGITAGSGYNVNIAFEDYTVNNPSGRYDVTGSVIYYGSMNKTLDASIDQIIAPTLNDHYYRQNPMSNTPTIRIHNGGSTTISNISFQYGVADSVLQQYTWNGTLAALADTVIMLPAVTNIANMAAASASGTYPFIAEITSVNGQADQDATNDTFRSAFNLAPNWPGRFIVKFHPGNIGLDGNLNSSPAQGSWIITDAAGNIISSETNANTNTDYIDTVSITTPGFYQLKIMSGAEPTIGFCIGLHWWAMEQSGLKSGALWVKNLNGTNIPMKGYTYAGANLEDGGPHDDFGCEYTQNFYVSDVSTGVADISNAATNVSIYPNPANSEINVEVTGTNVNMSVSLINVLGQVVYTGHTNGILNINTSSFAPGIYTMICDDMNGYKKIEKVVVSH